jgi:hypothetical protein
MNRVLAATICVAAAVMLVAMAPMPSAAAAAGRNHEPAVPRVMHLAGEWRFLLDPRDTGMADRIWQTRLPDRIRLPGSTDQARYGWPVTRAADLQRPARLFEYAGAAWYQRDIVIPYGWRRRRITLFLERCHWETRVWVDNAAMGMRDSLSTPHVYDITTAASPGTHRLTIRVDNRLKYAIGAWASAVSEETQTNWNGIIGRIELRGTARVWLEEVRAYPDLDRNVVKVRACVGNVTGRRVTVTLSHSVSSGARRITVQPSVHSDVCGPGFTWVEHTVAVPPDTPRWSEFSPVVLNLSSAMRATDGRTTWLHGAETAFGMRSIRADATGLQVNGQRVFLRGAAERCVFPITGYPPAEAESWSRVFRIARSYGLNHVRFHSWCPPEAAFVAADALGFLLQVEAPLWSDNVGKDPPRDTFVREETLRILDAYGSHPSFALFAVGNELRGDVGYLRNLVKAARTHDPRHLYASASGNPPDEVDDFGVVPASYAGHARDDARSAGQRESVPLIAHEVAPWAVFPDLKDVGKYTGVLKPGNLLLILDGLKRAGLLPILPQLVQATGRATLALAKDEIEALVGSRLWTGFQLLSLEDIPGHGTATVGVLNAFRESKDPTAPEVFRRFCAPTVLLACLPRRTYTVGEEIVFEVSLAEYGESGRENTVVDWRLVSADNIERARGTLPAKNAPSGMVTSIGTVHASTRGMPAPSRLTLELSLRDTVVGNSWNLWIYPPTEADPVLPPGVFVTDTLDPTALTALRDGGRVVLFDRGTAARKTIQGTSKPILWSPVLFPNGPLTMGILCETDHPALRGFPTEPWADRQWDDILERSRSMVIGETVAKLDPIVRVVDNYARNLPLALIAEARVGRGRLLVCGADLSGDLSSRPAAAQLSRSLLAYAASSAFEPKATLTERDLTGLFVTQP